MKTSDKGVLEIAENEGIVLGPYKDSRNIWTYGVGHTAAAGGLDPAKMSKVDTRSYDEAKVKEEIVKALCVFTEDIKKYEDRVNKAIKVPLKQHEFDSLVSFDLHTGAIFIAQLTKDINSGDKSGKGFMGWLKPKEVTRRRKGELNLFLTGNYEANGSSIPLYDTLPTGKTKFRKFITEKEISPIIQVTTQPIPNVVVKKGLIRLFLDWLIKFKTPKYR